MVKTHNGKKIPPSVRRLSRKKGWMKRYVYIILFMEKIKQTDRQTDRKTDR